MSKARVLLSFIKLTPVAKVSFSRNVQTQMQASPKFSDPDVPYTKTKATNDYLESCILAAQSGGKEQTALLHQAIELWNDEMRLIARNVERVANGDEAVILGAGFDVAKPTVPSSRPDFSVKLGDKSGTVILRRATETGVKAYIWQIVEGALPETEEGWTTIATTTQASFTATGLKPLTKYWFRVAVVTSEGTSDFCTPIQQSVI